MTKWTNSEREIEISFSFYWLKVGFDLFYFPRLRGKHPLSLAFGRYVIKVYEMHSVSPLRVWVFDQINERRKIRSLPPLISCSPTQNQNALWLISWAHFLGPWNLPLRNIYQINCRLSWRVESMLWFCEGYRFYWHQIPLLQLCNKKCVAHYSINRIRTGWVGQI